MGGETNKKRQKIIMNTCCFKTLKRNNERITLIHIFFNLKNKKVMSGQTKNPKKSCGS
uniref:Uncharacterized protein n=1 Tax=Anguilla anguilla TaxID=7936 RepID=A0A0E9RV57_ANGAN